MNLRPGRYLLRVDPVGQASASTTVRLRTPREEEKPVLALPASIAVRPGRGSLVFPLASVQGDLLLAQAQGAESLGLALEARESEAWVTLGTTTGRDPRIEVPLGTASRALRLRLWSEDRRDAAVELKVASIATPLAREADLRRGLRLLPVPGLPGDDGGRGRNGRPRPVPVRRGGGPAPGRRAGSGLARSHGRPRPRCRVLACTWSGSARPPRRPRRRQAPPRRLLP